MRRLSNMDRKGGLHQANGRESSNASQANRVNDRYVDNFHVHEFSDEGYLYYFKSDSTLGYSEGYSMDFILLSLMTQLEA